MYILCFYEINETFLLLEMFCIEKQKNMVQRTTNYEQQFSSSFHLYALYIPKNSKLEKTVPFFNMKYIIESVLVKLHDFVFSFFFSLFLFIIKIN